MLKLLAFLILFLPSVFGFTSVTNPAPSSCPNVSSLQKTGQSSSSITYTWNHTYTGAQYRVWYYRQADSYTSSFYYTSNPSYSFTGLSAGYHTFYFQALCDDETSGFIGAEDLIVQ